MTALNNADQSTSTSAAIRSRHLTQVSPMTHQHLHQVSPDNTHFDSSVTGVDDTQKRQVAAHPMTATAVINLQLKHLDVSPT